MKLNKWICNSAALLACSGLVSGPMAQAAAPTGGVNNTANQVQSARTVVTRDVALADGGILRGSVVDEKGVAQGNTKVRIGKPGAEAMYVMTDANGQFAAVGLTGGIYQVETLKGGGVYRVWTTKTAPPAAESNLGIVENSAIVAGQDDGRGGIMSFLGNPWVLGALVATAIAVPLALSHHKKSGS